MLIANMGLQCLQCSRGTRKAENSRTCVNKDGHHRQTDGGQILSEVIPRAIYLCGFG
jgi:hypothetical protein